MKKEKKNFKVWTCKIGARWLADVPYGADGPMRCAIEKAFKEITGNNAEFCFSGWGGSLDKYELEIVEEDDLI